MTTEGGLRLEIVTPRGVVLSERVQEVIAPSVRGQFGVLPGHLPMLAALDIGLLHYVQDGERHDVAVGVGFAEVVHDRTLVITDRCISKDAVDVLDVREQLGKVDERIEAWEGDLGDPKRLQLIEDEQWLAAQLQLIGDPPVPRVLETTRATDYSAVMPTEAKSPDEMGEGAGDG